MKDEKFYSRKMLKDELGWTDKMIKYLPKPAKTKRGYYASQIIPVWTKEQIDQTFALPEVKETYHKKIKNKAKRQIAAAKAVETKIRKTVALIDAQKVVVTKVGKKTLKKTAYQEHEVFMMLRGREDDDLWEINDWKIVNTIRHNYTNYEELLAMIEGQVGKRDAYRIVTNKVYPEILKAYPEYKDTIEQQMSEHQAR
ncbi:hypothetical protein LFYK43_22900 [Ligilactobacillus salitolerans]|uniref:Uncharacterized protein n=1 Tax=Ligilactobacillus salitolerans TaxID=1808352 RepID=A0A401IW96_9LACO|nr:hypothetical protein [Ligilactobacillus salitolerans]GBG95831.1 hypothetical protein LFYK43_22900 [Ligilactobacillus salitolerans]